MTDIKVVVEDAQPINATIEDAQPINISLGDAVNVYDGADANYSQSFTNKSELDVQHNLGKFPAVSIFDSAGDEVEGEVNYTGLNSLQINFNGSFSGTITLN